LKLAKAAR